MYDQILESRDGLDPLDMSLPQNFLKLYERHTHRVVAPPSITIDSSLVGGGGGGHTTAALTDSQSDKFTNNSSD